MYSNDNIVFKKFSSNYLVVVENGYETNPLIKYTLPKSADIGLAYCLEIGAKASAEMISQLTRIALEDCIRRKYKSTRSNQLL